MFLQPPKCVSSSVNHKLSKRSVLLTNRGPRIVVANGVLRGAGSSTSFAISSNRLSILDPVDVGVTEEAQSKEKADDKSEVVMTTEAERQSVVEEVGEEAAADSFHTATRNEEQDLFAALDDDYNGVDVTGLVGDEIVKRAGANKKLLRPVCLTHLELWMFLGLTFGNFVLLAAISVAQHMKSPTVNLIDPFW